jgi:hypothetical protein
METVRYPETSVTSASLHGFTFQNTVTFTVTAVRITSVPIRSLNPYIAKNTIGHIHMPWELPVHIEYEADCVSQLFLTW